MTSLTMIFGATALFLLALIVIGGLQFRRATRRQIEALNAELIESRKVMDISVEQISVRPGNDAEDDRKHG